MKHYLLNFAYLFVLVGILSSCQTNDDLQNVDKMNTSDIATKAMRRTLTNAEAQSLKVDFPSLNTNNVTVTGEADYSYNCIAWSLGISWRWINPPKNIYDFEYLYNNAKKLENAIYNYSTGSIYSNADIFGFGISSADMKHASIYYSGNMYESKLGQDFRITHDKYGIEGGIYGYISIAFDRSYMRNITPEKIAGLKELARLVEEENVISEDEKENIRLIVSKLDVNRSKFDNLFAAWKSDWQTNPKTRYSNNTNDAKTLDTFIPLVNMGKSIIPLLIEKLLEEENFFALTLYDELQGSISQKITYDSADIEMLEGEQNRAKKTIRLWYSKLEK